MLSFKKILEKLTLIRSPKPFAIQFDISNRCNFACSHCYQAEHSSKGELTLEQWSHVFDKTDRFLKKFNLFPVITVCGGEPLARPDVFEIFALLTKKWPNVFFTILTNGSLVPRYIDQLSSLPITVQISLDGPTSETNDFFRGAGTFVKAISGIEALVKKGIEVKIQSVLTKSNANSIESLFALGKKLGIDSVNFTRFIPIGNGQTNFGKQESLVKEDLKKAYSSILKYAEKYKINTNKNLPLFCLIDNKLGKGANLGATGFVIGYNGEIKFSSRSNLVLGNILTSEIEKCYIHNELLTELRKGKIEKCSTCKYFWQCGGDRNFALATTGNILAHDNGCWITAEEK